MSENVIVLTHTPDELETLYTHSAVDRLERLGRVVTNPRDVHLSSEDLYALAPDVTVVVSEPGTGADGAYLARAERLLAFVRSGVEILNVDIPAASAGGVLVVNTPGRYTTAVVELVVGYLVALTRDLTGHDRRFREAVRSPWPPLGHELSGEVIGIVGLGDIGRQVAHVAGCLGMRPLAYDEYVDATPPGVELTSLDDLLARSRFVSVHAKLTEETRHLIGARELALMRRDAYLVNTSRGAVVDEAAVADALRAGMLAGAAVDVFATEPDVFATPLRDAPNTVLTPHIGGFTGATVRRQADATVQVVEHVLSGEVPAGVVNPDALPLARLARREGQPG